MSEEVINDFEVRQRKMGKSSKSRFVESPSVAVVRKFREIDSWLRAWVGSFVEAMPDPDGRVRPEGVEWCMRRIRKYTKARVTRLNELLDTYAKIKRGGLNYKALEDFNKKRKWDVNKTLARMDSLLEMPVEERFRLKNLVPVSYAKTRDILMRDLVSVISQRTRE